MMMTTKMTNVFSVTIPVVVVVVLLLVTTLQQNAVAFSPPPAARLSSSWGYHAVTTGSTATSTSRSKAITTSALFLAKTRKRKKGSGGSSKKTTKVSYAERLQLHKEQLAKDHHQDGPVEPLVEEIPEEMQLAKQMVDAQRKSVDMLTFIRERVEGLPLPQIRDALRLGQDNDDSSSTSGVGYIVVDDFLANDEVVTQLQQEGSAMVEIMETDLSRLGSGEFMAAIVGGDKQYTTCPRTVEMVVSTAKHLAASLSDGEEELNLDPSICMASMRTYVRSSRLASLSLVEDGVLPLQPYDVVVDNDDNNNNNNEKDARKVTMLYYPIAAEWSAIGGGGIVVEQDEVVISAKRDRLILLRSDTCRYRPAYFEGNDELDLASCLELHLVTKPKKLVLGSS